LIGGNVSNKNLSQNKKVLTTIILFLCLFILSLLFSIIVNFCISYFKLGYDNPSNFDITHLELPNNDYVLYFLLLAVPLYEELMFRLMITDFDKDYVSISLSFILTYFVYKFLQHLIPFPEILDKTLVTYAYLAAIGILLYFPVNVLVRLRIEQLREFWTNYFNIIIYLTTLLFASLHYKSNFSYNTDFLAFQIIYLVPIYLLGLCLCYVRKRFGFIYAVTFHMAYNLPNILLRL
jgi:hypothetical protein